MDDGEALLREEVYSLALQGLVGTSLQVLNGGSTDPAPHDSNSQASNLLRARLLLVRGQASDRAEAKRILAELAQDEHSSAWRAGLELARLVRSEGDATTAMALLTRALECFRANAEGYGRAADGLSRLISEEVAILQSVITGTSPSPEGGSPSEPSLDRRSLLRLVDLGKRLATENDPDQVLRIVLHEAVDLSGAHRGFVVTVRGEEFDFALAEKMDWSEVDQPSFEVSITLIRRVIREGRSILLNLGAADSGGELKSLNDIGVLSVACIPLVHAGCALGVLYLDSRDASHSFGNSMRQLFDLFAAQAAAALENAREHQVKSRALETAEETIRRHKTDSERRVRFEGIVGSCDAMQRVYRMMDRVVPTELPVVVLGETGTGKELVARLVHSRGPRSQREFVATNCAGIPETLLESELFGHERGAFTGADRARAGLLEIAHRGTLFLDEVGDMSPKMQASLLRVLQSGEVRRLGGRDTIVVDVRVIAATHRNLEELVQRGEFRQDLYFRLNVLSVHLPALRERAEDIPALVTELMAEMSHNRSVPRFTPRAMRRLVSHDWPGNVRELQNVLRRLAILNAEIIDEDDLPPELSAAGARAGRPGTLKTAEADMIRKALDSTRGNKVQAAKVLGVDRKTLYKKLLRMNGTTGPARGSGPD